MKRKGWLIIAFSLNLIGFFYFNKSFTYAQLDEPTDLDSRVRVLEEKIKEENQIISTLQKKEGSIARKKQRLQNTIEQEKQKIAKIDKDRQDKEFFKQQGQQRQQEQKMAQTERVKQERVRQLPEQQQEQRRFIPREAKEPGEDIASWLARKKQLAQQEIIPYKQAKEPKEEISIPEMKTQGQETYGGKRESSIKAWLDKLDTKFRKVVW
jgi:peptidoglycan hydrolase CwlO-like protein